MKPLRILVTGATSATGSLAVRALAEQGHAVRCLVRTEANRRYLPASGIDIVPGDLEAARTLEGAFSGLDAVVHIAHIRFAPAIVAACERAGIRRAVFFSSTRLFTKFDCPTARLVLEGERTIEAAPLDYTILRPSMIYGSRRDNNVSRLIRYLRRRRVFPLVGGGGNQVQPVYTRDVVDALIACLERPAAIRSGYTLAGPRPLPYREMIETIAAALGRKVYLPRVPIAPVLAAARILEAVSKRPRITAEQIRRMGEDRAFDIAPARRDLDFAPVDFAEGLRRQLAGEVDAIWEAEPAAIG